MKRVLILGGGFGGVAAAHTLRELLNPEDEIIVVDRRDYFIVGFRKTWALLGEATLESGKGSLAALKQYGIKFIQGSVTSIDPKSLEIKVDDRSISGDAIIVALGAQLAPDEIPGFSQYALNIYSPQEIPKASQILGSFAGGRIVVGVFGLPYKCPAAPYEIALLVNETMRSRNVEASVEVFTPQPMSLPVLGDAGCGVIEGRLGENGVTFLAMHKATSVEAGDITFSNGKRRPFDMLLGIAPHRCPEVVVESGLAASEGWVKVDKQTLETSFPNVYAVGDIAAVPMANGKRLPMAGVFAEAQGIAVAQRIAATFLGQEAETSFAGTGGCYLEVGGGEAMMVEGEWLAEPAPKVVLRGPDTSYLVQKQAFEQEKLVNWFG